MSAQRNRIPILRSRIVTSTVGSGPLRKFSTLLDSSNVYRAIRVRIFRCRLRVAVQIENVAQVSRPAQKGICRARRRKEFLKGDFGFSGIRRPIDLEKHLRVSSDALTGRWADRRRTSAKRIPRQHRSNACH